MSGDKWGTQEWRWVFSKLANLPYVTEPTHRKPSKLGWALMMISSALLCCTPLYCGMSYSARQREKAKEKDYAAQRHQDQSSYAMQITSLTGQIQKSAGQLNQKNNKISELEARLLGFSKSEPERLKLLRDELRAYKNTHPESITKEAFDALQSKFDSAFRRAEGAERDFQDYKLLHPEEVTPQLVANLRAELASLRADFESYKTDHPYSRSEQDKLARKCSSLEEKLKAQVRQDNAGIPVDWKGRIIGYHDSFDEGHLYFCIPYSVGKSESDFRILGDKIPESVAKKYKLTSYVLARDDSWDYDHARVVFKIVDEGKYEYSIQLKKGHGFAYESNAIQKEDLLKFLKRIMDDNER